MESKIGNCYIVSGIQYGDEGKGTIVDYVVKQKQAPLIVRYGGGPQAAHQFVIPNGIWHCFSHYGSGMFWEKSHTLLSKYMLVYPQTLDRQTEVLEKKTKNPVQRLQIDQECYIITPYHQMMSRVMQILRSHKKGSTGLGVGQTAQQIYQSVPNYFPKTHLYKTKQFTTLQIKDLLNQQVVRSKLTKIVQQKKLQGLQLLKAPLNILYETLYPNIKIDGKQYTQISNEVKTLVLQEQLKFICSESLDNLQNTLKFYKQFVNKYKKCFCNTSDVLKSYLQKGQNVVFQGSQGALLDVIYGFYPHTTKTICSADNAISLIKQLNLNTKITKIGVLRCYSHRHGQGPFVPYSQQLTDKLPQLHNRYSKWQGNFKIGYLDKIALKYGIQIFQPDLIAVTSIDRIQNIQECLKTICTQYTIDSKQLTSDDLNILNKMFEYKKQGDKIIITSIKKLKEQQVFKNYQLTTILNKCKPILNTLTDSSQLILNNQAQQIQLPVKFQNSIPLINYIYSIAQKQIVILSMSPTWEGKITLKISNNHSF